MGFLDPKTGKPILQNPPKFFTFPDHLRPTYQPYLGVTFLNFDAFVTQAAAGQVPGLAGLLDSTKPKPKFGLLLRPVKPVSYVGAVRPPLYVTSPGSPGIAALYERCEYPPTGSKAPDISVSGGTWRYIEKPKGTFNFFKFDPTKVGLKQYAYEFSATLFIEWRW